MSSDPKIVSIHGGLHDATLAADHAERIVGTRSGGGGGGDMLDKLEKRVEKLEAEVVAIGKDVAVIKVTMATKEDLQREIGAVKDKIGDQTWKIIGALFAAVAAGLAAARLLF